MSQKILLKRGLKANLPTLSIGELAFCTDTNEFMLGTNSGNLKLYNKNEVDTIINPINNEIESIKNDTPYSDYTINSSLKNIPKNKIFEGCTVFANKTYGTREKGCTLSAIVGENTPIPQILGTDTKGLAKYTSRDNVALYTHNNFNSDNIFNLTGCVFNSNSVTIPIAFDTDLLKKGMIIDTLTTPKCVGIISSINENIITMEDGWYQTVTSGDVGNKVTPTGTSCVINNITKIWGINNNIFINEGCANGVAEEIGVICNNPVIGEVGGVDLINLALSTHFGFRTRGTIPFQKAYINEGSWQGFNNEKVSPNGIALINTDVNNNLLYQIKNDGTMTKLKGDVQILSDTGNMLSSVMCCICTGTSSTVNLPQAENGKIINVIFTSTGCAISHSKNISTKYKNGTSIFTEKGGCTLVSDGTFWYAINSECIVKTQ